MCSVFVAPAAAVDMCIIYSNTVLSMIIVLLPNNSDCGLANICFRVYNMTIECVVASGHVCTCVCV